MLEQIALAYSRAINVELVRRLRQIDFIRFCAVGVIGFTVNYLGLVLFHGTLNLHILPAQVIAVEIALLTTFTLHSRWTYKSYRHAPLWQRLGKYHGSTIVGQVINTVTVVVLVQKFQIYYGLGLATGSVLALFFNFVMTRYIVWAKDGDRKPVGSTKPL